MRVKLDKYDYLDNEGEIILYNLGMLELDEDAIYLVTTHDKSGCIAVMDEGKDFFYCELYYVELTNRETYVTMLNPFDLIDAQKGGK